tara:strand:+ start:123 stop:389 length:267 start_codon:yes stop_codon:yes gene_type:complete
MNIDKNIKIPDKGSKGKYIDVIRKMETGDSVLFAYDAIRKNNPQSESLNFIATGRNNGYKLTQRTTQEGIRVWVTELSELKSETEVSK